MVLHYKGKINVVTSSYIARDKSEEIAIEPLLYSIDSLFFYVLIQLCLEQLIELFVGYFKQKDTKQLFYDNNDIALRQHTLVAWPPCQLYLPDLLDPGLRDLHDPDLHDLWWQGEQKLQQQPHSRCQTL